MQKTRSTCSGGSRKTSVISAAFSATTPMRRGDKSGSFYARSFGNYLYLPVSENRTHPYAISHPVRIRHTIDVSLPDEWELEPEYSNSDLPSAHHTYSASSTSNTLTLFHEYRSLADHVTAKDFEDFRKSSDDGGVFKSNLLLTASLAVGLMVGFAVSIAIHFWDPPEREPQTLAYLGIGGWMIVPVLGCCLLPVVNVIDAVSYFSAIGEDGFHLFANNPDEIHWQLCFSAGTFLDGFFFVISLMLLRLLFKHRTSFPYVYIGVLVGRLLETALLIYLQSHLDIGDDLEKELPRIVLQICVWGSYMLVSNRVRATFTARRKAKIALQPPPLPI